MQKLCNCCVYLCVLMIRQQSVNIPVNSSKQSVCLQWGRNQIFNFYIPLTTLINETYRSWNVKLPTFTSVRTLFFIRAVLMLMLEYLKPCSQKRMLCSLMNWIMHQSLMGYDCAEQRSIATDIWTCQVIIFPAGIMMLWNISFCRSPCSVQYMFCKKSLKIVTPIGSGQSCPLVTAFCSSNHPTKSRKISLQITSGATYTNSVNLKKSARSSKCQNI